MTSSALHGADSLCARRRRIALDPRDLKAATYSTDCVISKFGITEFVRRYLHIIHALVCTSWRRRSRARGVEPSLVCKRIDYTQRVCPASDGVSGWLEAGF